MDEHGITNVIHLAALQVPFSPGGPAARRAVNVVGTVNLFEAVKRSRGPMAPLVYTSSIGVFSAADANPATHRLEETAEGHPTTHYGVYKQANEGTARVYALDDGIASVGLRPMTVYGAGRDQGLTSSPTTAIAAAVLGMPYTIAFGGRTLFQYAEDVARTLLAASRSGLDGAHVFNLGGSSSTCRRGSRRSSVPSRRRPAGSRSHRPSCRSRRRSSTRPWRRSVRCRLRRTRMGSRPRSTIFRRLAAEGRLVGTEQGLADVATQPR